MSRIHIEIPFARLLKLSNKESKTEELKNFLEMMKLYLVYKLSMAYSLDLKTATAIVKIKLVKDEMIYIGLMAPSTYSPQYRKLVRKILIDDSGSFTKKVVPNNKISNYCISLSNSIELLWLDFMRGR